MTCSAQATPWTETLVARLLPLLVEAGEIGDAEEVEEVDHIAAHSNDLLELRLPGRSLMVKRGAEDWSGPRFRGAREAARMLAPTDIVAPRHLDVPTRTEDGSVLAWWRIPMSTVAAGWPSLSDAERHTLLESCGRLLRRLHDVTVPGHGHLADVTEDGGTSAGRFLRRDLAERLGPVLEGEWPDAVPARDVLLEQVPRVADRVGQARLVHGDPNLSNLLWEEEGGAPRCRGVLDLEAAMGGPPEVDLAYVQLVHSPLLAGTPAEGWMRSVLEGYGARPDPVLMVFFHAYHLLNIGLHEALRGDEHHAAELAVAVRSAAGFLRDPEEPPLEPTRVPPYLVREDAA